jgi:hypothetical protein
VLVAVLDQIKNEHMAYYNSTLLRKNGFFRKEYDEAKEDMVLVPISSPLSFYLQDFIEVEEGVLVSDLMNILFSRKDEVNNLFSSYMRRKTIEPYYVEMKKKSTGSCSFMSHVAVCWFTDIFPTSDPEEDMDDISIIAKLISIPKDQDSKEFAESLPLSLIPLNDWKKLEIYVNNEMSVDKILLNKDGSLSKMDNVFRGFCEFKLVDFIGAFLQEITMYGYPEDRDSVAKNGFVEDMFNTTDYSIVDRDNASDEIEFRKNKLRLALETEDYESAARIKKEIDDIKEKFSINDV